MADGGNAGDLVGNLDGPVQQARGALDGFVQACFGDRLEQVVDGSGLECLKGMLVEGGHDHDDRQRGLSEAPDHFEAAHHGHLEVEKNQVRFQRSDLLQGLPAVGGFSDNLDLGDRLQSLAEDAAGDGLIVHNQSRNRAMVHLCQVYVM